MIQMLRSIAVLLAALGAIPRSVSLWVTRDPAPLSPFLVDLPPQVPAFDFNLTSYLPIPSYTIVTTAHAGSQCYGDVDGCYGQPFAADVTYSDCGASWRLCICDLSQMTRPAMSVEVAVERLGRVPIGLRRFVKKIYLLSPGMNQTEPSAYTLRNGVVVCFGDCQMETWIHEVCLITNSMK